MDSCLEVKNLQINLRAGQENLRVVNGVDFSLRRGQVLGLVGESGCGKSVTCLSLMGLLAPEFQVMKGEILFSDQDLLRLNQETLRRLRGGSLGLIMQNPMAAFNPLVTIGRHFIETLQNHRDLRRQEAEEIAIEQLQWMNLPHCRELMEQYPFQLSGGMLQRVMIAIALSGNPQVLLADEPTTALDSTVQYQILGEMGKLQERYRTAILLVTHDFSVVAQMADEVAVMYCGYLVEKAPVRALFDQTLHPYTQGLLASRPGWGKKRLIPLVGQPPTLQESYQGCPFGARCPQWEKQCREYGMEPFQMADEHWVRCVKYR